MQDRTPMIAESGISDLPSYYGDYPAKLLFSLRRWPKGRTLKDLVGDLGALAGDLPEVTAALLDLEDLGLAERVEIGDQDTPVMETMWRIAR